jgi:hypothetical protein
MVSIGAMLLSSNDMVPPTSLLTRESCSVSLIATVLQMQMQTKKLNRKSTTSQQTLPPPLVDVK